MTTQPELPLHIEVALTVLLEHLYAEVQKRYDAEQTLRVTFNAFRTVAEWLNWEPR